MTKAEAAVKKPSTPDKKEKKEPLDPHKLLARILVITLAFPLICAFLSAIWPAFVFPAEFALLSFGAFAGILIYVFVDPLTENKITVGGITLGGAAALMFVFPYFFSDKVHERMNGPPSEAESLDKIQKLEDELGEKDEAMTRLEQELKSFRNSDGKPLPPSDTAIVERLKQTKPNSDLGITINTMQKSGEGPFNPRLDPIRPMVSFTGAVPEGTFRYCENHQPDLNTPLELDRLVNGESMGSLKLVPDGPIGPACTSEEFGAVLQVGCDAVRRFLKKTEASGCTERTGVLWEAEAPEGKKRFELVGYTLNRQMTSN